jgi:hypothetical protein
MVFPLPVAFAELSGSLVAWCARGGIRRAWKLLCIGT